MRTMEHDITEDKLYAIQRQLDLIQNIVVAFDTKMDNIIQPSHYVRIKCENARQNAISFDSEEEEAANFSSWSSYCTIY